MRIWHGARATARVNTFHIRKSSVIRRDPMYRVQRGGRGPFKYRFFANIYGKWPRPRRGGGGDGLGGARSPGETTSLVVALVASTTRRRATTRVPTPQPNLSRPYG